MFTYIITVKFKVQVINDRKAPAKDFGLVIIIIPQTSIIIPLYSSYYMPKKPQNTISQIELKNYNKFISVKTEALRWLKIATDTGMKLKVETTAKKRYQKLL